MTPWLAPTGRGKILMKIYTGRSLNHKNIYNLKKIIEEINDDPDRKPSQKEFRKMEYDAMRAGLKSIQEKEARLARISAENFCNLQGIY